MNIKTAKKGDRIILVRLVPAHRPWGSEGICPPDGSQGIVSFVSKNGIGVYWDTGSFWAILEGDEWTLEDYTIKEEPYG